MKKFKLFSIASFISQAAMAGPRYEHNYGSGGGYILLLIIVLLVMYMFRRK